VLVDRVLHVPWEWPVGAVCAFVLTLVTTPAGVSGAVLLLPIQLSVLHVPSPAVTPTNLLFNVAAVRGGLLRFWHERRLVNKLTWLLVAGMLPGVIAGAVIRVEFLSGGRAFQLVAAGVLLPLGLWLALGSQRIAPAPPDPSRRGRWGIWLLSLLVGTIGGIYGIGGGSILAPILLALGYSAYEGRARDTHRNVSDFDRGDRRRARAVHDALQPGWPLGRRPSS
jgi:uncharacterized membrane protein YfcA